MQEGRFLIHTEERDVGSNTTLGRGRRFEYNFAEAAAPLILTFRYSRGQNDFVNLVDLLKMLISS